MTYCTKVATFTHLYLVVHLIHCTNMGAIKDGPQTIPRWFAYHSCKCYFITPSRSYHLIYLIKIALWTAALRMACMLCQLQLRKFYTPLFHTGPGRKLLQTSMVGMSPPTERPWLTFCLQWTQVSDHVEDLKIPPKQKAKMAPFWGVLVNSAANEKPGRWENNQCIQM